MFAFEYAGEDFNEVAFFAGGSVSALSRFSSVEENLNVFFAEGRPAGQPSTTAPRAFPWDSPQVVTLNLFPNDDWLILIKSFLVLLSYFHNFIIAKCKSFVNRKHWN